MIAWSDAVVDKAFREIEEAFRRAFLTPYWDTLPPLSKATVIAEQLHDGLTPELHELATEVVEALMAHTTRTVGAPRARDRIILGSSHAQVFLKTGRRHAKREVTP